MTIIHSPRPADLPARADALFVGRALLLPDRSTPDGRPRPSVVISCVTGPAGGLDQVPTDLRLDPPEDPHDGSAAGLAGIVDALPMLDAWIIDLSLRHERVTVVTPTDVLCSVPLVVVPPGWMAEVAARGHLDVVVLPGSVDPTTGRTPVPARATTGGASLAARIPVCLSD